MTEPPGFLLSYEVAAAKLAAAFWLTHCAVALLRRGALVPGWQIVIAILTVLSSLIAWRSTMANAWFVISLLAMIMLFDGLRRWLSQPAPVPPPVEVTPEAKLLGQTAPTARRLPIVTLLMSLIGFGLSTVAIALSADSAKIEGQPHAIMIVSQVMLTITFALLLASTLELTVGLTGSELLALPWKRLSAVATFVFLCEILVAGWVILKLKPTESVEMTAAPVLYEFSRLLLGYIAWCVPRRMLVLVKSNKLQGQASLALSGWIALICLALAMALPNAWPWNILKL